MAEPDEPTQKWGKPDLPRKPRLTRSSSSSRYLAVQAPKTEAPKRRLAPLLGLLLVAIAGSAAAYVGTRAAKPRPTLAGLAPARTALWLEAMKPRATWESWKTPSRQEELLASATWARIDAESKKLAFLDDLGLPRDERTATLLLGQELALGIVPQESGPPATVLMTELDVLGLAKALALQGDASLVDKLGRALGGDSGETYKGVSLHAVDTSWGKLHVAFLRPVLVASDRKEVLEQVIDTERGDAPSLGASKAFLRETGALPASAACAYFDLRLARDTERFAALLSREGSRVEGKQLSVLASDLAPLDGVAAGLSLEEGLRWSRSSEEIFPDAKPCEAPIPGNAQVWGEARGLAELAAGGAKSPAGRRLAEGDVARWIEKTLEHPGETGFIVPEEGGAKLDKDLRFEARLAAWLGLEAAKELVGQGAAFSLTVSPEEAEAPLAPVIFLRNGPLTRAALDLVSGYALAHQGQLAWESTERVGRDRVRRSVPSFFAEKRGTRSLYGLADEQSGFYWAQVGPWLAVSMARAPVAALLDRKPEAPRSPGVAAVAKLAPGWSVAGWADLDRYHAACKEVARQRGKEEPFSEWAASQSKGGTATFGAWVAPDFTSLKLVSLQTAPTSAGLSGNAEPAVWKTLPEESIGSFAANLDAKALYGLFLASIKATSGEAAAKALEDDAKAILGKSLEEALVRPLGASHGISIVPQERLLPEGFGSEAARKIVALPAAVAALELRDGAGFEDSIVKLVKKAIARANEAEKKRDAERRRFGRPAKARKPYELAASWRGGSTFYRLALPDEDALETDLGAGFAPCFTVSKGWFLVATSEAALARAVDARQGRNLAGSKGLARLSQDLDRSGASFAHLSFTSLLDQLERDAEPLARNFAPRPRDFEKPPEPPVFAISGRRTQEQFERDLEAYDRRYEEYAKDHARWAKKLADFRERGATENAAELARVLHSLRFLGGVGSSTALRKEGVESVTIFRLEASEEK